MRDEWHEQVTTAGEGDLRALFGVLDRPSAVAPIDDGLHRMLTSMAAMRIKVVVRPR